MKLVAFLLLCSLAYWAECRSPPVAKGKRLIGGQVASAGQFPWMVAIYTTTRGARFFCGGSLISDKYILTAAQCVYESTYFTIHLGSNTLSSNDRNRLTVTARQHIYEPRFDPTNLRHDIAVIRLDSPVNFSTYIQPIVYATFGWLYPGEVLQAIGWGQDSDSNNSLLNNLHYTDISIIDQHECQAIYGTQLWGSMVCAVGSTFNEGICYGDTGGPVIAPAIVGDHMVLVAIPSWISQNGCESTDPTGYTRIDAYHDWITQVINNETLWNNTV